VPWLCNLIVTKSRQEIGYAAQKYVHAAVRASSYLQSIIGNLMTFNLLTALPVLAPKAIAWAEKHYLAIAQGGEPLTDDFLSIAKSVGVLRPELIRVAEVPILPLPDDPELLHAALATGLLGPDKVGLTLGHGIYVCSGHKSIRLLSHEFRHVYQYEQAGSIAAFLPVYLHQIATFEYDNAPLEVDARAHEREQA
jgi:hypothetical protein